ncbi:hypothetical protein [Nocardia xishanensis]|uniref:hypothetical protein n=1 Tax=Nocardia xishanensis TaxID=238964 RepID=UPI000834CAB0|nr:hypothetical protein [Nocardia xishanensis]
MTLEPGDVMAIEFEHPTELVIDVTIARSRRGDLDAWKGRSDPRNRRRWPKRQLRRRHRPTKQSPSAAVTTDGQARREQIFGNFQLHIPDVPLGDSSPQRQRRTPRMHLTLIRHTGAGGSRDLARIQALTA